MYATEREKEQIPCWVRKFHGIGMKNFLEEKITHTMTQPMIMIEVAKLLEDNYSVSHEIVPALGAQIVACELLYIYKHRGFRILLN